MAPPDYIFSYAPYNNIKKINVDNKIVDYSPLTLEDIPESILNISNKLGVKEKGLEIKKKFQFSLEWEKNQLAIWDNRSMLHQATPFKGNRIMHRITIY